MSIMMLDDRFFPEDPDPTCLLCSTPLTHDEPTVVWTGITNIFLHGGCATSFVLRLARDAWEVERDANGGKYTLTRR
jgi:hypothetical protein